MYIHAHVCIHTTLPNLWSTGTFRAKSRWYLSFHPCREGTGSAGGLIPVRGPIPCSAGVLSDNHHLPGPLSIDALPTHFKPSLPVSSFSPPSLSKRNEKDVILIPPVLPESLSLSLYYSLSIFRIHESSYPSCKNDIT